MAKKKKSSSKKPGLGWGDYAELSFLLIDKFPQTNPKALSARALVERVRSIDDFSGDGDPKPEELEHLAERWHEERVEMEDDLGPLEVVAKEDLDEDDYRDDKMADEVADEDSEMVGLDEYEDDEDEDEFESN